MTPCQVRDSAGRILNFYDAQVRTDNQFIAAAKLFREWFADVDSLVVKGLSDRPLIQSFLKHWRDYDVDGLPQLWILYSYPTTHSIQYHALLMLKAVEGGWGDDKDCIYEPEGPMSSYIAVEALCRDPWSDPYALASWATDRALSLSEELGGCNELRFPAPETDVALQLALRKLGYHCEGIADPSREDGPLYPPYATGNYFCFSKLLRLRSRQSLGLSEARKSSKKYPF